MSAAAEWAGAWIAFLVIGCSLAWAALSGLVAIVKRQHARAHAEQAEAEWERHVAEAIKAAADIPVPDYEPGSAADWRLWAAECGRRSA